MKISSNQLIDVDRPTKIVIHRDEEMYQQTIRKFAANRREFEGIPDTEILSALLEDPRKLELHNEQHKRVARLNLAKFRAALMDWMVPSTSFADALKIAQLLAAANDKTGFDFMVKRLNYPTTEDLQRLCNG